MHECNTVNAQLESKIEQCQKDKVDCSKKTAKVVEETKACVTKKDACLAEFNKQQVGFDVVITKKDQCEKDLDKAREERKSVSKAGDDVCPGKIADFQKTMKESVSQN